MTRKALKMSIEMIGLIVSAASFVVTVVFWLIDSFVFEKKLRKKKKATIYRVTLKKNPKNIDIYDEDYLGKIYLKHDGKIRRLGNNDIRYLEDKRKVEMTNASDYAYSKENPYTTNNIRNPHDPHDARVPDEEEKEITVSANDYIFVGENEHQNSAAFYIKRGMAFSLKQLILIIIISISASSALTFYISNTFRAHEVNPLISLIKSYDDLYDKYHNNDIDSREKLKHYSEESFINPQQNPFATDSFKIPGLENTINTIGSSMWYAYGKLLIDNIHEMPNSFKNFFVTQWFGKNISNPTTINLDEAKRSNLLVWRTFRTDNRQSDGYYRLRVAYIEDYKDGSILISESGLTVKGNKYTPAIILPGIKYVVVTRPIQFYKEDLTTPIEYEKHDKYEVLEIIDGPKEKYEKLTDPITGVKRDFEYYYWYCLKDSKGNNGWVRLEDYNRGKEEYFFNTEFNLQGFDPEPHPVNKYWSPLKSYGIESMRVLRLWLKK